MKETQRPFQIESPNPSSESDSEQDIGRPKDNVAGLSGGKCQPAQPPGRVDEEQKTTGPSFRLPLAVPEEQRPRMAAAIAAVNLGLAAGRFDMDLSDGQVSFTAAAIDDPTLPIDHKRHLGASLGAIQRYLPRFLGIVSGGACPEQVPDE